MKLKKIILVFKTHFDIGFTNLASCVIDNYAKDMLEEVIATCKGTQDMGKLRYVWTMPSWPLMHIVKNCTPDLKKELDALIESGQVVWHGLPFTTHTDFCSQKEYLEGLRYSRQLAEMYHKPCPVSGKMTDVPGHSIMLPDILHQAGIRFLHLGCNEFATPPDVPDLFFWQAPGGRRLLTMYSKGGYGTGLVPPQDWEYPVWMALMHTHDNKGPQSADAIRRMAEQIRESYPDAEIVCGTMDDFYRELIQCDLSNLPVLSKDMADTWIHGVGAYPREVALVRSGRRRMESLQALYLGKWLEGGNECDAKKLLEDYYEEIALFEEHTWGADVKTWMGPDRVYEKRDFLEAKKSESYCFMEKSWEEQRERARRSEEYLQCLKGLLEPSCGESGAYTLFHGGSAPYTGWVKLPGEWEKSGVLVDGRQVPCEKIGESWCCYVTELPGFVSAPVERVQAVGKEDGQGGLSVVRDTEDERYLTVENHRYRLTFCGTTGEITLLQDKKQQRSLLEKNGSSGIFSYQYDKYGYDDINEYLRQYGYHFTTWGIQDYGRENYPFCGHETFTPMFVRYELDGSTIRFYYCSRKEEASDTKKASAPGKSADKYGDAPNMELEITIPDAGEEIFLTLHLKDKQESPFVESGSLLFPLGEGKVSYRMQKGGSLLNPEKDIVNKANHSLYCLENGMAAFGENGGICLKTFDAPLVALGGTGIYHYAPEYEDKEEQCIYVSLFNNMWGTNFPQWTGGDMSFHFSLSGVSRESEAELLQYLTWTPDTVSVTRNHLSQARVRLPENMRLIGVEPGENGICIQLADISGQSSDRSLTAEGCLITPVDLYGRPQKETAEGECVFRAAAWGVENFRLQRIEG